MKMQKLKNRAEEASMLVAATMHSLDKLYKKEPWVVLELVRLCRDRDYKPFGECGNILVRSRLVTRTKDSEYVVHGSIKNIVLSAFEGEGLEMELVNPCLEDQPEES